MKHTVPHDLPFELAKTAAKLALEAYRARFPEYEPQVTWADERTANVEFSAKGIKLRGTFEILTDAVAMDMDVPLLLRPFRAKAMEVIENEVKAWIEKAKSGELQKAKSGELR